MSEVFSEHICRVVSTWDKEQFNLFEHYHCIVYKVILDVNVLGALFSDYILSYKWQSLIVITDGNRGKFIPLFLFFLNPFMSHVGTIPR